MGFPRQKSWSRLSFPSPGDLSDPGIKPTSPTLVGRFLTADNSLYHHKNHIGTNMVKNKKQKTKTLQTSTKMYRIIFWLMMVEFIISRFSIMFNNPLMK